MVRCLIGWPFSESIVPVPPNSSSVILVLRIQLIQILLERLGHLHRSLDVVWFDDHPAPLILVAFCLSESNSDLEGFSMSVVLLIYHYVDLPFFISRPFHSNFRRSSDSST